MDRPSFATICAFITVIVWGSSAAVSKLLISNLNGLYIIGIVSLLASVAVLIWILFRKKWELVLVYWREKRNVLLLGGFIGTFISNWFFVESFARLPAQETAIIYYLWPLFSVVFVSWMSRFRFSRQSILGLIVSFVGVVVVLTGGSFASLNFSSISGVLLALGAAVSYALFLAYTKRDTIDPVVGSFYYYTIAGVLALILALLTGPFPIIAVNTWLGLFWLGIGTSLVGLIAWMAALQHGNPARISAIGFLIPFFSLVYIYFLVGESIQWTSILGLCLIIVGIVLQPRTN